MTLPFKTKTLQKIFKIPKQTQAQHQKGPSHENDTGNNLSHGTPLSNPRRAAWYGNKEIKTLPNHYSKRNAISPRCCSEEYSIQIYSIECMQLFIGFSSVFSI